MFYWFIVNNSTGTVARSSANVPPDDSLAPSGFTLVGPYEDPLASNIQAIVTTPQAYLYQNGQFVANPNYNASAIALAQSQASQMAVINAGYSATVEAGFTSNATGTSDTYAIDDTAYPKWTGILSTIAAGIAPTSITVKDISGKQVTLTQTQFKQFALDGFNFLNAQEQQLWALEAQVNAQTSVPTTPVTWAPGAYTPQPAPTTS